MKRKKRQEKEIDLDIPEELLSHDSDGNRYKSKKQKMKHVRRQERKRKAA